MTRNPPCLPAPAGVTNGHRQGRAGASVLSYPAVRSGRASELRVTCSLSPSPLYKHRGMRSPVPGKWTEEVTWVSWQPSDGYTGGSHTGLLAVSATCAHPGLSTQRGPAPTACPHLTSRPHVCPWRCPSNRGGPCRAPAVEPGATALRAEVGVYNSATLRGQFPFYPF